MVLSPTPEVRGLMLARLSRQPIDPSGAIAWSVVADGRLFQRLLTSSRPSVVVVYAPPATTVDIAAVATERRRRTDMRAVLVDRPKDAAERLAALRRGFDEAFEDTITPDELAGRLELLIEQPLNGAGQARPISLGPDLVLDVAAHELRRGGKAVHLRPREYALLEVLARHPGLTLSRQQLLEAVGARATTTDARTVDVHVRWLREKLGGPTALNVHLVTVRGVGYRLDPVNRTLTNGEQRVDTAPGD